MGDTQAPRDEIRVLMVDDHVLVRQGLGAVLRKLDGIVIVGEADSAERAVEQVAELRPDIIVMDIEMPGMSGIDAIAPLQRRLPGVRIVILSMHDDAPHVSLALQAGASAYLIKGAALAEFELALRAVARGEAYLSPAVSRHVVEGFVQQIAPSPLALLTPRQLEILRAIAEGESTKAIAFRLKLSSKTVETHRAQLMDRLAIHDLAGLVRFAVRHRLVDDGG